MNVNACGRRGYMRFPPVSHHIPPAVKAVRLETWRSNAISGSDRPHGTATRSQSTRRRSLPPGEPRQFPTVSEPLRRNNPELGQMPATRVDQLCALRHHHFARLVPLRRFQRHRPRHSSATSGLTYGNADSRQLGGQVTVSLSKMIPLEPQTQRSANAARSVRGRVKPHGPYPAQSHAAWVENARIASREFSALKCQCANRQAPRSPDARMRLEDAGACLPALHASSVGRHCP
jgi:hypothetical protein